MNLSVEQLGKLILASKVATLVTNGTAWHYICKHMMNVNHQGVVLILIRQVLVVGLQWISITEMETKVRRKDAGGSFMWECICLAFTVGLSLYDLIM